MKKLVSRLHMSNTIYVGRLWNFHSLCRKSLATSSALTMIWVEMKCNVLDTESTTIITVSKHTDSRNSMTKLMLIVLHYVSKIIRGYSLWIDKYWMSLVLYTNVTNADILTDVSWYLRPPIILQYHLPDLLLSYIFCYSQIMTEEDNVAAEI